MALPFGKYQLLKKLAAGGMGQVFLARAEGAQGFEKLLVIKRILPHLVEDEEFLNMFFDEARIAARLNHPNVAQIFELGEVNGAHYLAMEYVAGEDVRRLDRLARKQETPIPLGGICRIIADAAAGLDYAHKARDAQGHPMNLIHRDVSPQNILVGFDGGVKLIDFGVAKAAGRAQHTATGILKGKYAYMSPEQVDGQEIDHRSDVFALGVVFWELLTGKRLFKGDSDVITMRLVRDCQVPPPSKIDPQLPAAVDALTALALAKDPARRYPDAGAMRMAIEDFAIAQHLPASAAHLVAFMKELYKDRIAEESGPMAMDELAPTDVLEDVPPMKGTPSRSATAKQLPPERVSVRAQRSPAPAAPGESTLPVDRPARRRSLQLGAFAIGALAVGSVAGAIAIPKLTHPDTPPRPARQVTAVVPVPPPPPPAPKAVSVQLVSEPSGARVQLDGRDLGQTPLNLSVNEDAAPAVAVFSLPGFETSEARLSAKDAPTFSIQLKRKALSRKNAVHLGIKTDR